MTLVTAKNEKLWECVRVYTRAKQLPNRVARRHSLKLPLCKGENKSNNIISRTFPLKWTFINPYIYRHAPREPKKSLFNLRQRVTFVLRAGVEPAQVSLSVFETDASTDSAIEAFGSTSSANVMQKYYFFLFPPNLSSKIFVRWCISLLFSSSYRCLSLYSL